MNLFLLSLSIGAVSAFVGIGWGLGFAALALAYYGLNRLLQKRLRSGLACFWAIIALQLGPLVFWKNNLGGERDLAIPLGLSFFLFQAVSFTVDLRKGKIHPFPSFVSYLLYLLYFPKFLAGPLDRFSRFQASLTNRCFRWREAFVLLAYGCAKKFLLADHLHPVTKAFFDQPGSSSPLEALVLSYAFALEFYCDFSAYTDLARGTSLLFGVDLPKNFHFPYLAKDPQDFWRRWHISLSEWFRDYVHYPLFFLTKSLAFTLIATFFLMGIWHGLRWNFAILGFYWGIVLALFSLMQPLRAQWKDRIPAWLGVLVTFHLVVLSFFVLRDFEGIGLARVLSGWEQGLSGSGLLEQGALRVGFCLLLFIPLERARFLWGDGLNGISRRRALFLVSLALYFALILLFFTEERGARDVRFLYFQF